MLTTISKVPETTTIKISLFTSFDTEHTSITSATGDTIFSLTVAITADTLPFEMNR